MKITEIAREILNLHADTVAEVKDADLLLAAQVAAGNRVRPMIANRLQTVLADARTQVRRAAQTV